MRVLSSREFNQDVGAAKRIARDEPVVVTDRGRPTHVLMSIQDYRRHAGQREGLAELLALPEAERIELTPADRWGG